MNHFDRIDIGKILKSERKKKGWTLDNLANMSESLSSSTLSNIERGFSGVKEEKIKEYCRLLGIKLEDIPKLTKAEDKLHKKIEFKLFRIEQMIDLIGPEASSRELKKCKIPQGSSLELLHTYLEARCYYHKKKYLKALDRFNKVLQLFKKHPELEYTNIHAACYKELGRISFYYYNNLEQALNYTEQGLTEFNENGERKIIKYALLSCKASYQEKMQKHEEALKTIQEIWLEKDQWYRSIDVVLNILEIRSNLAAKNNFYDEAINHAYEGLEVARANKKHERALELITTLGNIYTSKGDYEEAEAWYQFAQKMKKEIKRDYLFVSTYTQLGSLYLTIEKLDLAKKYLHLAVDLGEKSEDGVRFYYALVALGDYYMKTNDFKNAVIYYEKALDQAENQNFSIIDPDLYAKLSRCYQDNNLVLSQKYMDKYIAMKLK